jgi:hypothetical protein
MNIDKNPELTEQEFIKAGLPYDSPMLTILKQWRQSVSGSSGNFNQDPDKSHVMYPIRSPFRIIRKLNLEDGKEYLTTVEQWTGVDAQRNEVTITVNEFQVYDIPIIQNIITSSQSNVHITNSEKKITGYKTRYTTPFTKKAFDEAYDRSNELTVELVVQEIGRGKKPESVFDKDKFVSLKFNDLLNINKDISKGSDDRKESKSQT